MILCSIVSKDHWRGIQDSHDDIDLAVVIQIAKRCAASNNWHTESCPGGGRHIDKSLAVVPHQQWRLFVFQIAERLFNRVKHMALGHKYVSQAVVVRINKASSPSRIQQRNLAHAGLLG